MSDLDNPTNEQPTNDEEQPQGAPVDWKEMARKWEKLASRTRTPLTN